MAMNFFITCTHKDSDLQTLQKFTAAPCCSSKRIFSLCDLSDILLSIQITQMFLRVLHSILNSAVMASWTRRVHHLPFSRTVKVTRTGVLDALCFVLFILSTVILCVNWNTAWMGHILYYILEIINDSIIHVNALIRGCIGHIFAKC